MNGSERRSVYFDKYALLRYLITLASLILSTCLRSSRGMFVTCAVMLISLFVDFFQFADEMVDITCANKCSKVILYTVGGFCLFAAVLFLFYTADIGTDIVPSYNANIDVMHPISSLFSRNGDQELLLTYKDVALSMILFNCVMSAITIIKPWILMRQSFQLQNDLGIFYLIEKIL